MRKPGISLKHAADCLQAMHKDMKLSCTHGFDETWWDYELKKIIKKMKVRARFERRAK